MFARISFGNRVPSPLMSPNWFRAVHDRHQRVDEQQVLLSRETDREREGGGKRQRLQFKPVYVGIPFLRSRACSVCSRSPPFLRFSSPSPVKLPSPISYLFAAFAPVLFRRFPKRWIFGRICGWIWLHSRSGYRRGVDASLFLRFRPVDG